MKTRTFLIISLIFAFIFTQGGCKKQKSVLQESPKSIDTVKIDTVAEVKEVEIDTSDNVSFKEANLDSIFAEKVKKNLVTIYFDFNSYKLNQDAIDKLSKAASFLASNKNVRILIEGHCDERGTSEYNMALGEKRARSVKNFLINYGVDAIRMEITSWGEEKPARTGCMDDSCHALNRRVEFKVLAH